ncbi:DNA repair metallo-beta-lactamase [Ceratobasidium sp. AG-Ba]|nr:DNA repair metallo-beta-lactamase [Ceratobasidium sp. AG-Ba]
MVTDLSKSSRLAPYLSGLEIQQPSKVLDCIYLDTASMLGTQVAPSKAEGMGGLLEILTSYSQDTHFFINAWTWGYEDVLLRIAAQFNTKKYTLLTSLENYTPSPSLVPETSRPFRDILTCDANVTRFHACERFNQCGAIKSGVSQLVKRRAHRSGTASPETSKVVYINPSAMAKDNWWTYTRDIINRLRNGQFVDVLRVPLSRHSTLAELQSFVGKFRPKNIFPNTLIPHPDGLDWACLLGIFAGCLSQDGYEVPRTSTLDGLRDRFLASTSPKEE